MDAYEATRVVFSRIQALDPDNAAKIMGLLLIQDHGEKEMIRLAFGPEALLRSVILKARKDLGLLSPSTPLSLFSRQNSSRIGHSSPSPWASQVPFSISNISDDGVVDDEFLLHKQQLSLLNEQAADPGGYWDQGGLGWKPCLYFARGFCKNGSSCRFVHGPADDMSAAVAAAVAVEQQYQEIMLLRSKSQRLAAAAFPYSPAGSSSCKNLNFMLQQLQNDSQRAAAAALMLENDDHKFMGRPRMERDFIGMMNPGSRQIYLTFPAESTFREEDVSNYFSIYGSVQDVRIPYQQKRIFGFVTFVYSETMKLILAKGNPHFVCDTRDSLPADPRSPPTLTPPSPSRSELPVHPRPQPLSPRFNFYASSPVYIVHLGEHREAKTVYKSVTITTLSFFLLRTGCRPDNARFGNSHEIHFSILREQSPSPWMTQKPLGGVSVNVNVAYEEGRDEVDRGALCQPLTQVVTEDLRIVKKISCGLC